MNPTKVQLMNPTLLFHQNRFPNHGTSQAAGKTGNGISAVTSCRSLVTTLKWLSFDVRMDGQNATAFDVWYARLWHALLIVLDIRFLVEYSFAMYDVASSLIEGSTVDIQALFFPESVISLALLFSFVYNRSEVISTMIEIIDKSMTMNQKDAYRSIVRCSNFLSALIVTLVIVNFGLAAYFTTALDAVHSANFNGFLMLLMPAKRTRAIEQVIAMVTYNAVLITSLDIFCLFQIFEFHLLFLCYRQLNVMARRQAMTIEITCRHLYEFQMEHNDITRLVRMINRIFSPSIFFFTVFSVVKMTAGLKSLIGLRGIIRGAQYVYYAINVFRIVCLFVATSIMAAKIYNEARISVDVMQEISLRVPTCCTTKHKPIRDKNFKECYTTGLFVTQVYLNPVGITAFDMFTINYGLITIVISTLATYLSAISSMEVVQNDTNSPFNGDD